MARKGNPISVRLEKILSSNILRPVRHLLTDFSVFISLRTRMDLLRLFFFFLRISISLVLMCILSPAVALCAGPEAIPDLDLNDFPPDISPAESAQLERETEENARECDRLHNEIFQKTKEIARAAGVDDNQKLEKIVDAVKFLSDVEDLAEEARIPYLHEFKAKIENKETWFEIDKEMKRWGGRGL